MYACVCYSRACRFRKSHPIIIITENVCAATNTKKIGGIEIHIEKLYIRVCDASTIPVNAYVCYCGETKKKQHSSKQKGCARTIISDDGGLVNCIRVIISKYMR